jgi:hypothetical protein
VYRKLTALAAAGAATIGMVWLLTAGRAHAQSPPAGWKILRSAPSPFGKTPGGKCSVAVPNDWVPPYAVRNNAREAVDPQFGLATATLEEWPTGNPPFAIRKKQLLEQLRQSKATALKVFHKDLIDLGVLEDSATRLVVKEVNTEPTGSAVTWHLLAAGDPICGAEVSVGGISSVTPSYQASARKWLPVAEQIVATFAPAR